MNLIEVVILAGAQCLSPIQSADAATVAGKVPCAVLIHMNPDTGDVEFTPPTAATDPQVIASLVKTEDADSTAMEMAPGGPTPEGDTIEVPPKPAPPEAKVEDEKLVETGTAKTPDRVKSTKQEKRRVSTQAATKRQRSAKRRDSCGSYKAVWYTNKEGRRKYRCVKAG